MSEDYKQLPSKLGEVVELMEQTIAADKAKRASMANQLRDFFKSLKDGGQGAKALETSNQAAENRLRAMVGLLGNACAIAEKYLHIPDQLRYEGEQWQHAAKIVYSITESSPGREYVPGWTGPAAEAYTRVAIMQTEACKEWHGLTRVVVDLYRISHDTNVAMLEAVYQGVLYVVERRGYLPEPSETFAATWKLGDAVQRIVKEITSLGATLEETCANLAADLVAAKNATNLLQYGWPTDDSMFGVKAADIPQLRSSYPLPELPPEFR